MIAYLTTNKEWIFSGIGVLAISLLISLIIFLIASRSKNQKEMSQKSGNNSKNLQAGRDITFNKIDKDA